MSTPQAKGGPVAHESSLSEKSDVDQYPLHGPKLARYTIWQRLRYLGILMPSQPSQGRTRFSVLLRSLTSDRYISVL